MSVRGPSEALAAAQGGAHIADVEYPVSALGTPYPLNIKAVRDRLDENGHRDLPISTNIGEDQAVRSAACQAALGVATAGADYIKCGFAALSPRAAQCLGDTLVRTVKKWFPEKKVVPVVFPEDEFLRFFDPLKDGPPLVGRIGADGLLIDTYHKGIGKGLLDYYDPAQLARFVEDLHALGREAWVAGSISRSELPAIWRADVDVVCVREAACGAGEGSDRFGAVEQGIVAELVATVPLEE
ncbi:MAG: hypothetical protein GTO22_01840 [Gemmatimonadales bacterium]|nr:hypothetical protein [Gemmatimonadales bacterium]